MADPDRQRHRRRVRVTWSDSNRVRRFRFPSGTFISAILYPLFIDGRPMADPWQTHISIASSQERGEGDTDSNGASLPFGGISEWGVGAERQIFARDESKGSVRDSIFLVGLIGCRGAATRHPCRGPAESPRRAKCIINNHTHQLRLILPKPG